MIDGTYRTTSEKTTDNLYNAMYLVIAAWQVAVELNSSNDRHSNALLGLLTMAEGVLEQTIDSHNAEWEIVRKKAIAEGVSQ